MDLVTLWRNYIFWRYWRESTLLK